jgi:hypothetical protein
VSKPKFVYAVRAASVSCGCFVYIVVVTVSVVDANTKSPIKFDVPSKVSIVVRGHQSDARIRSLKISPGTTTADDLI